MIIPQYNITNIKQDGDEKALKHPISYTITETHYKNFSLFPTKDLITFC